MSSRTDDDARRYLLGLMPPGDEVLYDLAPTGDVFNLFQAIGQMVKKYAFDAIDALRTEIFPQTSVDKLRDWETAVGIVSQVSAQFGTVSQRQQALIAKLRELGPFIDTLVAAVAGPLLGYFSTTAVQIVKADQPSIMSALTQTDNNVVVVANGSSTTDTFYVVEGGIVSEGSARVTINYTLYTSGSVTVELLSPNGTSSGVKTLPRGQTAAYIRCAGLDDVSAFGTWTLVFTNNSGAAQTVFTRALTVGGIATNQNTMGGVFDWGVYADPVHLGENATPDLASLRRALQRIKHSHTTANVIQSLVPYPDTDSGLHAAIPDECIPT